MKGRKYISTPSKYYYADLLRNALLGFRQFEKTYLMERYYIQSAYAMPDEEKMEQEQASLINVPDSFKKIIVVESGMPLWRNEQGITIMNIYDFLDEDSLNK